MADGDRIVAPLPKMGSTGASLRDLLWSMPLTGLTIGALVGVSFVSAPALPVSGGLFALGLTLPYLGRWFYARKQRLPARLSFVLGHFMMAIAILFVAKVSLPKAWLATFGDLSHPLGTIAWAIPYGVSGYLMLIGSAGLIARLPDPAKVAAFD